MKLFVATYDSPDSAGSRTKYISARSIREADRKACNDDRMLLDVDEAPLAFIESRAMH